MRDPPDNPENHEMEDAINGYITNELVTRPNLLPIRNDTRLMRSRILDSLSLMRLVTYLEDHFQIVIDVEEVVPENFETVDAICKYVKMKKRA
jgi:acyl carrier protein